MNAEENLVEKLDWKKMDGLIPVVVQDANTKEVLMLAYANREALEKTLKTGFGTYWSRSRQQLWVKGETSGTRRRSSELLPTVTMTRCFMLWSRKDPFATQAQKLVSITNSNAKFRWHLAPLLLLCNLNSFLAFRRRMRRGLDR